MFAFQQKHFFKEMVIFVFVFIFQVQIKTPGPQPLTTITKTENPIALTCTHHSMVVKALSKHALETYK